MDFISMKDVHEAECIAKAQRIAAAKWLRVDELQITSPDAMMLLHRVRAAAALRKEHWGHVKLVLAKDRIEMELMQHVHAKHQVRDALIRRTRLASEN